MNVVQNSSVWTAGLVMTSLFTLFSMRKSEIRSTCR